MRHLSALDAVYSGAVGDHRGARVALADLDAVSEDLVIGQLRQLEQFQWFVRAHLMDSSGDVVFRQSEQGGSPNERRRASQLLPCAPPASWLRVGPRRAGAAWLRCGRG